jgi:hypothetical protein
VPALWYTSRKFYHWSCGPTTNTKLWQYVCSTFPPRLKKSLRNIKEETPKTSDHQENKFQKLIIFVRGVQNVYKFQDLTVKSLQLFFNKVYIQHGQTAIEFFVT